MSLIKQLPTECIEHIYDYMDMFALLMIYPSLPEWKRKEIQFQLRGHDTFLSWYYTPSNQLMCSSVHLTSFPIPTSYMTCSFISFLLAIKPNESASYYSTVAKKGDIPMFDWLLSIKPLPQINSKVILQTCMQNACVEGYTDMMDRLETLSIQSFGTTLYVPSLIHLVISNSKHSYSSYFTAHIVEYIYQRIRRPTYGYCIEDCIIYQQYETLHVCMKHRVPFHEPTLLRTLLNPQYRDFVLSIVDCVGFESLYPEAYKVFQKASNILAKQPPIKAEQVIQFPIKVKRNIKEKQSYWMEYLGQMRPRDRIYTGWLHRCLFDAPYDPQRPYAYCHLN